MTSQWPQEIVNRFKDNTFRNWRHDWLRERAEANVFLTPEVFAEIATRLKNEGTFDIKIEKKLIEGLGKEISYTRAAETDVWPMGTHVWIRDMSLVADRLLRAGDTALFSDYKDTGKNLLVSALSLMSSPAQLDRFEKMIAGEADQKDANNWPHIFLESRGNLSSTRDEAWAHKQDAWQMTAVLTMCAIRDGLLLESELKAEHKKFLYLAELFLEVTEYWKNESSGSWEEIEEVRSSVLAWEVALLAERGREKLAHKGRDVLRSLWPNESETREEDAALIYLLQLGTAKQVFVASERERKDREILERLSRLDNKETGGMYRYLSDSYQRLDFFRPDVAARLTEYYGSTSGEASSAVNFKAREGIVPQGRQAAWVHPVWQLAAYWGRKYLETNDEAARRRQHEYFKRGLRLITGEGEATVEPGTNGVVLVKEVAAWRMPECYITLALEDREVIVPSPHTPLNWAVAEAIDAFAVMEKTLN